MTLKKRLVQLELKANPAGPTRILIHYEGDDFGMCDGKRLTLAEWDAIKGDDCVILNVVYDKPDPRLSEEK
jgi:hypothetical protein